MASNRMADYAVFIGTWNTTGEVLAVDGAPATTLAATDTYRWLPGRHFIMHDADARFGDQPSRSMEVIGYDADTGTYAARSYDDQGVSDVFEVALDGVHWRIRGAAVRFDGRFDAARDRLTGVWERKSEHSGWQPWIRLTLVRA